MNLIVYLVISNWSQAVLFDTFQSMDDCQVMAATLNNDFGDRGYHAYCVEVE